jgi:hypothetical protein
MMMMLLLILDGLMVVMRMLYFVWVMLVEFFVWVMLVVFCLIFQLQLLLVLKTLVTKQHT